MRKKIGVLALQGAVSEHIDQIKKLGGEAVAVKTSEDLTTIQGLIIPGGESTAISRLIQEVRLYDPIREFATKHHVFGTCAGLILCGSSITDDNEKLKPLGLIDIAVTRNGFGRQIDSFEVDLDIKNIGPKIPSVFIRAPYIASVGKGVDILAKYDGKIVMAEQGNVFVCSFHPELTQNSQVTAYFMSKVGE